MGDDSGEKTEEPTPHKLREARKKGQIAKSQEFTSAILLLTSFYTLKVLGKNMWLDLANFTHNVFNMIPNDFNSQSAQLLADQGLSVMFSILGPVFFIIVVVTVIFELLQTGFLFSTESLVPKLENIDPINGFKKFFSLKQYVELIKSVIKMSMVVYILYVVIKEQYFIITQSQARNVWIIMRFVGDIVFKVIIRIGILYLVLALFDYYYQKFEFMKSMRMSKKEIKEEYKRLEGDPTVKQRQKEAQRAMAQGRQLGAVPDADVVVTNPIHVAVALYYDPKQKQSPIVVAKGRGFFAGRIKEIADENRIPIIENPPLARAIFKQTKVGQEVPPEHYKVVAEILAFVYHLKKKRKPLA